MALARLGTWHLSYCSINRRCDGDDDIYWHLVEDVSVYESFSQPQTWQVPCDVYFLYPSEWVIVVSKTSVAYMLVEWLVRIWGVSSLAPSFLQALV